VCVYVCVCVCVCVRVCVCVYGCLYVHIQVHDIIYSIGLTVLKQPIVSQQHQHKGNSILNKTLGSTVVCLCESIDICTFSHCESLDYFVLICFMVLNRKWVLLFQCCHSVMSVGRSCKLIPFHW